MGRLTAPVPGLFRVCSGYPEQPKTLNLHDKSALFRVFRVQKDKPARARTSRARAHNNFFSRARRGNTLNTRNALQPRGIPRSGYPEQTTPNPEQKG
jgi:hypothetical protein